MSKPQRVTIPQADPKAGYWAHKDEIDAAIARVLASGWYILGQEVTAFEEEFASYLGVNHAIGVASGTDALELALRACGVGADDIVFTVSHTAAATVAAVERVGATPVLVDIDLTTYTMDPNHLEDTVEIVVNSPLSVGARPKAVLPVHLYGHPADMPAILEIAQRYELLVIEDCAQSHGATLYGRMTGTWGDIAAFSFYPTKNMGAFGDGGMVVSDDLEMAERIRALREYGWQERYVSQVMGMNSRLDELQAAILRVKLRYLDEKNAWRRKWAKVYGEQLSNANLVLPFEDANAVHVYHQYVIRTPERDSLRSYLKDYGIGTLVHYPIPVHLQPAYRNRLPEVAPLQYSVEIAQQILSLPMYPELSDGEVRTVANCILEWFVST